MQNGSAVNSLVSTFPPEGRSHQSPSVHIDRRVWEARRAKSVATPRESGPRKPVTHVALAEKSLLSEVVARRAGKSGAACRKCGLRRALRPQLSEIADRQRANWSSWLVARSNSCALRRVRCWLQADLQAERGLRPFLTLSGHQKLIEESQAIVFTPP